MKNNICSSLFSLYIPLTHFFIKITFVKHCSTFLLYYYFYYRMCWVCYFNYFQAIGPAMLIPSFCGILKEVNIMGSPCLGQCQSTISNSLHKLEWNNADKGPCSSTQLMNIKCWQQDYDLKNLLVKIGIQCKIHY